MSARCYDENCMVSFLELESSFAHVSPQFGNVRCLCCISDRETWKAALLCQTELGDASSGRALETRRLSCMSYYITCSCSMFSDNLTCYPSMSEKLVGCVLEREKIKNKR